MFAKFAEIHFRFKIIVIYFYKYILIMISQYGIQKIRKLLEIDHSWTILMNSLFLNYKLCEVSETFSTSYSYLLSDILKLNMMLGKIRAWSKKNTQIKYEYNMRVVRN